MDGEPEVAPGLRDEFLRRALVRDMEEHLRGVRVLDPAARDALAKRLQEVAPPRARRGADEAGGEGSGGGHGSVLR